VERFGWAGEAQSIDPFLIKVDYSLADVVVVNGAVDIVRHVGDVPGHNHWLKAAVLTNPVHSDAGGPDAGVCGRVSPTRHHQYGVKRRKMNDGPV